MTHHQCKAIKESETNKTHIGVIPSDWKAITLDSVVDFIKKPKGLNINNYSQVPFISMEQIPDNKVANERFDLKEPETIKSGTYFEKGDLLLARITPSFENGKQCIAKEIPLNFGYATTEVFPLRGKRGLDTKFLFYLLKSKEIRNIIAQKMEGTTGRQRVPKKVLEATIIPLPQLDEQRKISYILSTIQQAIEATEKVITAAQELKKSLMQHLFTYGPVSVEEADQVPLKETEEGLVPEHWGEGRIHDLIKQAYSGGTPSTKKPEYWNGNINWTTSAYLEGLYLTDTPKKITEVGLKESSSKVVPKDNLLIGTRVGVGKVAINKIDVAISQDLTGLIVDNDKIDLEFLAHMLLKDEIQNRFSSQTRGTTIKGIPKKDVLQIPVCIPPLREQQGIKHSLLLIDKKIYMEYNIKNVLHSLFNSMLHHLMTGKLRVKDLDINIPEEAVQ